MALFSKHAHKKRGGVIIDIGSGSVGVALVDASALTGPAEILWSHREYILNQTKRQPAELLREVHTALINALLELGGAGLSCERYTLAEVSLDHIQVTLCAPWAHTATKTLRYAKDEPFTVTKQFIKELMEAGADEADKAKITELGLVTISQSVGEILLNEYAVEDPINTEANSLSLSIITSAIAEKMLQTIQSSCEKILPEVRIEYYSFINILHKTLQHLRPHTSEVCIIDVTDEATEIGIVRDDVLRYCTHRPAGLHTLSHMLSEGLTVTEDEAYSILKRPSEDVESAYKVKDREIIAELFKAYEKELIALFNDTNDDLSIAQTIFVHTDSETEGFFTQRIQNSALALSASKKSIHLVNEKILDGIETSDSALAVCAFYYKESPQFKHSKNVL